MGKLEDLTVKIFNECKADGEPVSMDEAREMAQMELDAKNFDHEVGRERKAETAPKKPHVVKVSDEKKELFNTILQNLTRAEGVESENVVVLNENKLIQVRIGDKTFKINITESRNKKNKAK